jgi:Fur family transcriptional regulator, peroxide stress response regulator
MKAVPSQRAHRSSRQRQIVRQVLASSHDHPTAQTVLERARLQVPSISLGTVYRNLQLLVEQGLLLDRKIGKKPARYEGGRTRHYHVCCTECGVLEDLAVPYQEALDRRVERMVRYRLREHRMEFYGICPRCQARLAHPAPGRRRATG